MADLPQESAQVNPAVGPGGSLPLAATPAAFGAGIGEALEQGAEVANKIHRDALQRFNQTTVLDAHNQLQDFNQARLFDPKSGVLNQNTGKDAPATVDKTMADYDAQVAKIAGGLTNDQQREQFARLAQENRHQVQQHLNGYETRQIDQYHTQVTQATAKNAAVAAVQSVGAVVNDPDPQLQSPATRAEALANAGQQSIELGTAALRDEAARKNQPKEVTDEQVAAYQSAAHYGVLQSLMSQGRDQDAKAYYDAHKDKLEGEHADAAARQVEAGSTAGEALRRAPGLVYGENGQVRDRADVYQAIADDKSLQSNPKLLAETEAQVQRLFQQHDQATKEQHHQAMDSAYELMKNSPQGFDDPAVQAKVAGLPFEEQEQLRVTGLRLQKAEAKQAEPPDNSDAFYGIMSAAYSDKIGPGGKSGRQLFIEDDVRQYRGLLSAKDYGRVMQAQLELRGQVAKNPDTDTGFETATKIINNTLAVNHFQTEDVTLGKFNDDTAKFHREVNLAIDANGGVKKLGTAGVQKICDDLMLQTVQNTERSYLNPARYFAGSTYQTPGLRRFQALPPDFAFNVAQMSTTNRQRAVRALNGQGIANPTEQQIYQTYLGTVPNAAPP